MPLDTTNFHPQGPVKSVDLLQFYNLFTGLMTDQPVAFSNSLTIGGNQGLTTVPLRIYGAVGQNTNLLDLYADKNQAQPGFGFSALGRFAWGPGGAQAQDTFLSRIATQNGHASDTPGLLIQPLLEVIGNITATGTVSATGYNFTNGATLTGPAGNPNQLNITQDLSVARDSTIGRNETLGGVLNFGASGVNGVIQSRSANVLNVESPNQYLMLEAKNATHLAANAYFDGSNWQRWDTAAGSGLFYVSSGGVNLSTAVAAANPLTNWVTGFGVDNTGSAYFAGKINVGAQNITGAIAGDIALSRSGGNTAAAFFGNTGANYLFFDGTNFNFSKGLAVTGAFSASGRITGYEFMANNPVYYFGSSGSYYLSLSSTTLQAVNMNILSWGWVGLAANGGIYMSWNGGQICFTHSIIIGQGGLYFNGSTAYGFYWNGGGFQATHYLMSGGAVYLNGNSGVYFNFDGTWIYSPNNRWITGVFRANAQICTSNAYNGSNGNGFLAPNNNPGGVGLGQSWSTWACVDHAVEYGLRVEPIRDALCYVRAIKGYSYEHAQFVHNTEGERVWLRNEDDALITRPLYGFKPSEVAQYLPELVGFSPSTGEPESIDLDRMVVVLWEAFKQHADQTDARLSSLERSQVWQLVSP